MGKNTSISLSEHFEEFIASRIESGRYHSTSEVIREGLRLLEVREKKIQALNEALEKGEKSGLVKNFDPDEFLKELNEKYV